MKTYHAIVCVLVLLAIGTQAHAVVLYGSTSGPTSLTHELFTFDATNGAPIQDIGPLNDSGGHNYPMTGLAVNPLTGVLYGSTGNSCCQKLVTINPATAQVTVVGDFNAFVTTYNQGGVIKTANTFATMADIGFDKYGHLYGISSVGNPNLYSIDINTGQATLIGNSGVDFLVNGGGLAISPDGVFYSTPENLHFGTYNPTTGVYANVTSNVYKPPANANNGYGSLDFNGNALYAMTVALPSHLVLFDLTNPSASGNSTDVGPTVNRIDGMAFSALPGDFNFDGTVDAADYVTWRKDPNGTQAQYDAWRAHFGQPASGVGSGSALPSAGLLSATAPEPTTLAMLILAMASTPVWRRNTPRRMRRGL